MFQGMRFRRLRTTNWSVVVATLMTYGLLLCYLAAVPVMIVSVGETWSGSSTRWVFVLAVAADAASVEIVRRWLRDGVEDLLFAHPENPYDAIVSVRRGLGMESSGGTPLATTIARAVRLPYVALDLPGRPLQIHGQLVEGSDPVTIPLSFGGADFGELIAGPRRRRLPLSPSDLELLRDLADQVAVSLFTQRTATETLESRTAIVRAREEERRRIRRDLHDGMGPTLAAMHLQLKAVQRLLPDDTSRASEIVDDLLGDVRATTADIRTLVYALRPPMLDELGLVGALRNHPTPTREATLVVAATGDLLALPAAVEVALYRIATEAIQNALKHAAAQSISVTIVVDDTCGSLTVVDDGRGLPDPLIAGVGISAIRERAEELAGEVAINDHQPSGTEVVVRLPINGSTA